MLTQREYHEGDPLDAEQIDDYVTDREDGGRND